MTNYEHMPSNIDCVTTVFDRHSSQLAVCRQAEARAGMLSVDDSRLVVKERSEIGMAEITTPTLAGIAHVNRISFRDACVAQPEIDAVDINLQITSKKPEHV